MENNSVLLANLKQKSQALANYIEQEFINLKFKSAKCAHGCFSLSTFAEAVNCEKECLSSVETAIVTLKSNEKLLQRTLATCIKNRDNSIIGNNDELGKAADLDIACYKEYYLNLDSMKSAMEKEFSFYY